MLPFASVSLPGLGLPIIPRDWRLTPAAVDAAAGQAVPDETASSTPRRRPVAGPVLSIGSRAAEVQRAS